MINLEAINGIVEKIEGIIDETGVVTDGVEIKFHLPVQNINAIDKVLYEDQNGSLKGYQKTDSVNLEFNNVKIELVPNS